MQPNRLGLGKIFNFLGLAFPQPRIPLFHGRRIGGYTACGEFWRTAFRSAANVRLRDWIVGDLKGTARRLRWTTFRGGHLRARGDGECDRQISGDVR